MFMHMSHLNNLCVNMGETPFPFFFFFKTMNRLIEWPGDTKHGGQQKHAKHFLFVFFFSKMHFFFNKCFVFNLARGGGLTKRRKALYITRSTVHRDEIHKKKKQMHQFIKGGKCVTK